MRITADAKGVDKGVAQATTGLDRLSGVAAKAGAAIAAAFTIGAVANFSRESIQTAAEAEAVWNRLSGTLRTVGVDFETVSADIEGLARSLQATTVIGDEDTAEILQTLVRISGDYAASMKEVETVANLAAGAQINLRTAAELVGKVMVGETGTLSRYGLVVKEGEDAMKLLQDRFRGMAENEAKTLNGQLTQLSNAWGDFKEAVGNALVELGGSENVIGRVTTAIQTLTGWVERNGGQLRALGDTMVTVGGFMVRQLGHILDGFNKVNHAIGTLLRWLGLLDDEVQGKLINLSETPPIIADAFASMADTVAKSVTVVSDSFVALDVTAAKAQASLDKVARLASESAAARKSEARTVKEALNEQRENFGAFADSIAEFAVTGKQSMSDFVDSAIADLTRLAIRMAAMKLFEFIVNPVGAATGTAVPIGHGGLTSLSPTIPAAASLASAGPALSASPAGLSPDAVAALNNRPRPMTPREAAQDEWWVSFFAEAYGVATSRGLRPA